MDAVTAPADFGRRITGEGTPARAWQTDAGLAAVAAATIDILVPPGRRAVLVAPHPDDEVLACGGLLQLLAGRAEAPLLVAVTDGEASHPGSALWPRERLRAARPRESMAALRALGLARPQVLRVGLADGGVARDGGELALARRLRHVLAPTDVVITTWRLDGHPDHEASARACAVAVDACGARLLEVPVWGWHWSAPADLAMPLARARKLQLSADQQQRKRLAIACFASQTEADPASGAAAVLPAGVLERLLHPFELYFT